MKYNYMKSRTMETLIDETKFFSVDKASSSSRLFFG